MQFDDLALSRVRNLAEQLLKSVPPSVRPSVRTHKTTRVVTFDSILFKKNIFVCSTTHSSTFLCSMGEEHEFSRVVLNYKTESLGFGAGSTNDQIPSFLSPIIQVELLFRCSKEYRDTFSGFSRNVIGRKKRCLQR